MKHRWRSIAEAALLFPLYGVFSVLPVDSASALGGWIGRRVGPFLPSHKIARQNLTRCFPEKSPAEIKKILTGMWDNLGRVMAEYSHLDTLWATGRIEFVGTEYADLLRDDGKPGLLMGGHLGNWEVGPIACAAFGVPLAVVYRIPNNLYVARLLAHARKAVSSHTFPKGPNGARLLFKHLHAGGHAGLLVDQKMNDGVPIPFFGRPAMTAPAIAQLGMRLDCPLVPLRSERLGGARFRVTLMPPLTLPRTGDSHADAVVLMTEFNRQLEIWVRERPEQWLWVHRRWPKEQTS
jgi:Kdo2-lipid IVA lauroyltransferase/acyltransferase